MENTRNEVKVLKVKIYASLMVAFLYSQVTWMLQGHRSASYPRSRRSLPNSEGILP